VILLTNTTDKISLITDFTCNVKTSIVYIDRDQTSGNVGLAERQLTSITTAGTTDILAAPPATTTRKVKEFRIENANTAYPMDVTLQYNANGILYELISSRLMPSDALTYMEDAGLKLVTKQKFFDETRVLYPANTVSGEVICNGNNNAGQAHMPGFTIRGLKANTTYHFMFAGVTISAATIGARFNIGRDQNFFGVISGGGFATVTNSNTAAVIVGTAQDYPNQSALISIGTGTVDPGGLHFYSGTFTTSVFGERDHVEVYLFSETSNQQVKLQSGAWYRVWEAAGWAGFGA